MGDYRIIKIDNENGVIGKNLFDTSGQTVTFSGITLSNGNVLTGVDSFVTGATMNGNSLELSRNQGLGLLSVDMSQFIDTDSYVTGFTYDNNNHLTLSRNGSLSDLTTSINVLSAVTISNYIDFGSNGDPAAVSGRTYFEYGTTN
jgi:hypothetical protein